MRKDAADSDNRDADEIRQEDGLVRYWMYFNGEQIRLYSALASAFFGVLWCFLYVLGVAQGVPSFVVAGVTIFSFLVWRIFDDQIRRYETSGWAKEKIAPKRQRIEIRIAILLWLLILVFFGSSILYSLLHNGAR